MEAVKTQTTNIFSQLTSTLHQLTAEQYTAQLPLLSENSIGKHVRHILEFYQLLLESSPKQSVNYDLRKRDLTLETSQNRAIAFIDLLQVQLKQHQEDYALTLEGNYGALDSFKQNAVYAVNTTLARELIYNLEHAIHHMAILKIAIQTYFPEIVLPIDFGVASSTVRHQQSLLRK